MKHLILLVGPPGSGKSTYAKTHIGYDYINQDLQGKEGHLKEFKFSLEQGQNIIIDRMNFSVEQRNRYLLPAKEAGYSTKIVVLHESFETCFMRCLERQNHETIKTEQDARKALGFFFQKYERVQDSEADVVERLYPPGEKKDAIICDLDGTLCNIEHRLHFVRGEGLKRDWRGFFEHLKDDKLNNWCADILKGSLNNEIILCSGRPDTYRKETIAWLDKHGIIYDKLFMRDRNDFRQDNIVKEQILDFEILTRYNPYFCIDDRAQVVQMWRKRGLVCLACADGDF